MRTPLRQDGPKHHDPPAGWMALKNRDPWKPYKEERGERIRTQLASEGEDGEAALEARTTNTTRSH